MGFRGGVKVTPPQRILVFKYPSGDRVKNPQKIFLLKPRTFFWFCFPLNQLKQKMGAKRPYSVEVNSSQTKYQMVFKPETYKI